MNLGTLVVAAALFGSQIKALINGDDVIIGPPEPPPPDPEPVCPPGWVYSRSQKKCVYID